MKVKVCSVIVKIRIYLRMFFANPSLYTPYAANGIIIIWWFVVKATTQKGSLMYLVLLPSPSPNNSRKKSIIQNACAGIAVTSTKVTACLFFKKKPVAKINATILQNHSDAGKEL
ncbi:MAG: hypothetical protein ACOCQX_03840 [Candidatus Nanoarchaeia archaeon]